MAVDKELRNARNRAWYRANSEKVKEQGAAYRASEKGKANRQRYYEDNKEKIKARTRERAKRVIAENKDMFNSYKAALGCLRCSESDVCCLDFHHKDPTQKEFHISMHYYKSLARLWDEVNKCIVLCSNCHRKLHRDERKGG